ncbi:MAG: sensor histidine kinase [Gemmatimonadaceae bacterium]
MTPPSDRPRPDGTPAGAAGTPSRAAPAGPGDVAAAEGASGDASAEWRRLLKQACARARTAVGADFAAVALRPEGGGDDVAWDVVDGASPAEWERALPLARRIAARAIADGTAATVSLPGAPPDGTGPAAASRARTALALPIGLPGEPAAGALVVAWRAAVGISAREVGAVQAVVAEVAAALERARLHEEAGAAREAAEHAGRRGESNERARGALLATLGYEIRTPLNAVIGYAELLELEIDGALNAAQRERLARLRVAGQRVLSVVTAILDLARIEVGELTIDRQRGDLRELLPLALSTVVAQAAARRVTFVERCAPGPGTRYVGDPERVKQILVTLLSNAVKHAPAGGRVTVQCARVATADAGTALAGAGPWTRVDVSDTGAGIAPERQARIFEPFEQGPAAAERGARETGLELAVSRRLARLMGGDVTVVSAPGQGARFALWLPAA